jgi:hypothetical protein
MRKRRRALLAGSAVVVAVCLAPPADARRSADPPPGEWSRGDGHVHDDHSSDGSLPRQIVTQEGIGDTSVGSQIAVGTLNGLDWMPLTDHRTYAQHWDPQWTSDQLLLIPGEEANGSPHATVLGHVDTLVDGGRPKGSHDYRHIQQSVWDVHAQDAVWGTAHPGDGEWDNGKPNPNASTVGPDTAEVGGRAGDPDPNVDYIESRWNAGYRFGVTGGSDSHFAEIAAAQGPGTTQTMLLRRDTSERGTLDALRAGRTSFTNGLQAPVLTLTSEVGGKTYVAGEEMPVTMGATLRLTLRIERGTGTTVYLYAAPGRSAGPIATYTPIAPDETHVLDVHVTAAHMWWRAESRGPGANAGLPDDPDGPIYVQAATSGLFADVGGPAVPRAELPLPPDAGGPDGAVRLFGEPGSYVGFPDVARSGGVSHVVAERHVEGATHVVYRRLAGGPEVDLAPASRTARFPRVAARESDVWVVWQDERAGQVPHRTDVYLRHSGDDGRTWEPERRLTTGPVRNERPVIALRGEHPVVAWQSNDPDLSGGAFEVLVWDLDRDDAPTAVSVPGKTVSAGTPADTRSAMYPASLYPALAVAGGLVAVVWQDDRTDPDPLWTGHRSIPEPDPIDGTDPDNWEILASVRGAGSWSAPKSVSNSPATADEHPTIAVTGSSYLQVAWDAREMKSSGVNPAIRTAQSTDGGASWSAPVGIGAAPEAMSIRPRLSGDRDGTLRIAWYDSRAADWRWSVATSTYGRNGWGAAKLLTTAGNNTWPALSGGDVVFTSDRSARRVQRDRTEEIYAVYLAGAPTGGSGNGDGTGGGGSGGGGGLAGTGGLGWPLAALAICACCTGFIRTVRTHRSTR